MEEMDRTATVCGMQWAWSEQGTVEVIPGLAVTEWAVRGDAMNGWSIRLVFNSD